ncbi:hypothetical protein D9M73_220340 [compost metagenome]
MLDQRPQAIEAFAQRRDMQGEDIEAVIQVLTEFAPGTQLRQVDLGSTDDAHIQINLLVAAHASKAAILQKAQQLDL